MSTRRSRATASRVLRGSTGVRPRLLFLGHTLPYPADRGVALRTYHVLRALATHYEIDALIFHRRDDPTQMPLDARVEHLSELGEVEVFEVPGEWSGRRRLWDRVRGAITGQSPSRWRFETRAYRSRVLELLFQRHPQVVHVDSLALHAHLPLLAGHPVVLAHHHVESLQLRERAELAGGRERAANRRDAQRVERLERHWLPRVTINTAPTDAEADLLRERAPEAAIEVVPPGLDLDHFTPGRGTGQGLAFVGGTTGAANRDALAYFATEILPRLRRDAGMQALEPISWVGPAGEEQRRRQRELGIDLTGYVEDIRPIVRPAACFIVPTRIGTPQPTRILQAWAMGRAVVSTSHGCEGLAAVDGENILIRDDPEAFARGVVSVLRDRELRGRLGTAGRETVESRHDWAEIGARMLDLYRAVENAGAIRPGEG